MHNKQFYSPAEIAEELSVSTSTVLRLINAGELPALRVSERIYRVPVVAFERYKSGTLERPSKARLGPVKDRPRLGEGESLAPTRTTDHAPTSQALARTR